jgi:hypothetical protein
MRTATHPRANLFIVAFLITMITTNAIIFILPDSYVSTGRIKVTPATDVKTTLLSLTVLTQVMTNLNLTETWGKRFNNGVPMSTNEVLTILHSRIQCRLRLIDGASIAAVSASSIDKMEAAQLANAVIQSYASGNPSAKLVEPAMPAQRPAGLNKPLSVILGMCFSAALAAIITTVVFSLSRVTGIEIVSSSANHPK